MDENDRMILSILEENCRISEQVLADMTNLSREEVISRIKKLEEEGIIKNYVACIDWEKAGDGVVAAIIELKVSPEKDYGYDKIAEKISKFRQVKSLRLVSGAYDLEILVTGRDIHEIARFVSGQIAPLENIRETGTILIMKTYKENGQLYFEKKPVERLPYSF
ncbi:Lrp/AsnC family transcriptional regulator [Methanoplanus limicola]|uniref:Transcriptional regulator, AsnC family n=1 Tax=Methanoplanus limicola DSM 2279 TaxID=937775 RepID=H1Z1V0_9EURY|nr:Lrp/AsnC family transcriptional regulator [Methanoplanus limicola]EHQ35417.1 transcriptional regulator, AsnC family [Methanoplanus limicola DSM 2279]